MSKLDSQVALREAACTGDLETVKQCINKGADKDAKDNEGWTALHIASQEGHLEIVQYLIETCRVNKEAKTNDGWTALHLASWKGYLEIAHYLIASRHADKEAKDNDGWTALHFAVSNGHLEIVQYLVETCRVRKEAKDKNGQSAYDIAIAINKSEVAQYLLTVRPTPTNVRPQPPPEPTPTVTFFFEAIEKGNLVTVQECFRKGMNMEAKDKDGWTALHSASWKGHLEIVQYLIDTCRVNKEAKDNIGWTALHFASWNGHLMIVQYLIETGQVDKDAKDNDGWTALHSASWKGHLEIVQYLVEACHVNKEARTNTDLTALHIASQEGHLEIVHYLIETCRVDKEAKTNLGKTALQIASRDGHLMIVQYLIATCHADMEAKDNDGWTALHLAVSNGHLEIVQYLIASCHVNKEARTNDGQSAYDIAMANNKRDVAQYLLTLRSAPTRVTPQPTPKQPTPTVCDFFEAIENGNLDTVQECISKGINNEAKNKDGLTALHLASNSGHLKIVQYLIETRKVDKDAKNNCGWTALHYASWKGHLESAHYLIETCRVNKEAKTNDGWTALHYASWKGHLEIVHYFIATCHADKEAKDNDGWTALHFAVSNGHLEIVQYLIEACHVNKEARTNTDLTALHLASRDGRLTIVKHLIEACHLDMEPKNKDGESAYDLAVRFNHEDIAHYLHQQPTAPVENDPKKNIDAEIVADRTSMVNMMNNPTTGPVLLSLKYLKMCTGNFTSKELGRGAYGTVRYGCDNAIGTHFAVKCVSLQVLDQQTLDDVTQSFQREISVLKRFRHPNIVTMYGYNVSLQQKDQFLVYEYLSRGSLADLLSDEKGRTRLPSDKRLSIMFQLARAVHFLHTGGIEELDPQTGTNNLKVFHRDIKSGNICLTQDCTPKLIDCGLAKCVQDRGASATRTGSIAATILGTLGPNRVFGTPGYICPRYIQSHGTVPYNASCDVFSIGVVFAELLVGCLQGGQSSQMGHSLGDFYCRYIKDDDDEPVKDGWKIIKQDADVVAEWNDGILEKLCHIAVQCMTPSQKRRISTQELMQKLGKISLENFAAGCGVEVALDSNGVGKVTEPSEISYPCVLCNQSIPSSVACVDGHHTCVVCIEQEIQRHVNKSGDNFLCQCGSSIEDDALFGKISTFTYNYYVNKRSLPKIIVDKLDEVSTNVNSMASANEQNSKTLDGVTTKLNELAIVNDQNSKKLDDAASANEQNSAKLDVVSTSVKSMASALKEISFDIQRVLGGLAYLATNSVKECPTVVWLVPADYTGGKTLTAWKEFAKRLTHTNINLYFVCQHSYEVVSTTVAITVTKDWLKTVAPVLAFGMILLKAALAIGGLPALPFPIPGLSREAQITLNENFVNGLLDDATIQLLEEFKAACAQGSALPNSESPQLLALSGPSYDVIAKKATKDERKQWSFSMSCVPNKQGKMIWVKNEYRKYYRRDP